MAKNNKLHQAQNDKNDEFYTQLSDIEKELKNYRHHFKDKVVLCNCDDPYESSFFKYFAMNFNYLGLKKLISTCYDGSPIAGTQLNLFNYNEFLETSSKTAYVAEITHVEDLNNDGAIDLDDIELLLKKCGSIHKLKGNGDFRSDECIEFLKEADIVVTNPPFSIFREYVNQLMEYNKKFIILANMNCLTYKDFFSLMQKNLIWCGYGFNMSMVFKTPYPNKLEANRKFVISKGYDPDKGYVKVPSICWFTNLDISKRYEPLILYKKYNSEEFPKYENYDAINVDATTDIPCDYFGNIGVPITFLDKYNPKQFEIVALGIVGSIEFSNNRKMEILDENGKETGKFTFNAKGTLYRKYNPDKDKKGPAFKDVETGELYSSIYARIIIRKKVQ